MKRSSDSLESLLGEWSVLPRPQDASFPGEVWDRIQAAEPRSRRGRWFTALLWDADMLVARPRIFAAVVCLGFAAGLVAAACNPHNGLFTNDAEMAGRYLTLFGLGQP